MDSNVSTIKGGFLPSPVSTTAPAKEEVIPVDVMPMVGVEDVLEVIPMEEFLELLGELIAQEEPTTNFVETPFVEYSTTDGLLLILVVLVFVRFLWSIIKGVY